MDTFTNLDKNLLEYASLFQLEMLCSLFGFPFFGVKPGFKIMGACVAKNKVYISPIFVVIDVLNHSWKRTIISSLRTEELKYFYFILDTFFKTYGCQFKLVEGFYSNLLPRFQVDSRSDNSVCSFAKFFPMDFIVCKFESVVAVFGTNVVRLAR